MDRIVDSFNSGDMVVALATLLDHRHLSIISNVADPDLACIRESVRYKAVVDGRDDLEHTLCGLLAVARPSETPKTLDLIGQSATGSSLLMLGSWLVDLSNRVVSSYFRELFDHKVLPRLGVHSVRLLGSLTASTGVAQWTICALSDLLGVEVYGTRNLIYDAHFTGEGFVGEPLLLAASSDLRRESPSEQPLLLGSRTSQMFDLDKLPTVAIDELPPAPWPRRLASRPEASTFIHLVRRNDGRVMPGLLAAPTCELAVPSERGGYHLVQILLEGELVRVGGPQSRLCYSVENPRELMASLERLPQPH